MGVSSDAQCRPDHKSWLSLRPSPVCGLHLGKNTFPSDVFLRSVKIWPVTLNFSSPHYAVKITIWLSAIHHLTTWQNSQMTSKNKKQNLYFYSQNKSELKDARWHWEVPKITGSLYCIPWAGRIVRISTSICSQRKLPLPGATFDSHAPSWHVFKHVCACLWREGTHAKVREKPQLSSPGPRKVTHLL